MPSPRIYTSPYPRAYFPESSIFTYLLSQSPDAKSIGGHPSHLPAIQDAETGLILTRQNLRDTSLKLAYGLRNHPATKLARGDTVLIFAPNSIAWPVLFFGCIAAGLKVTAANASYTPDELAFQYSETKPKVVFVADVLVPVALKMFKSLGAPASSMVVLSSTDLTWAGGKAGRSSPSTPGLKFEQLFTLGQMPSEEKFVGNQVNEIALMCFSSGTSGKPKGVMTTHKNLVSVVAIQPPGFPPLKPGDNMYAILPFFHIFGAVNILQLPLLLGVSVVIAPRFDPELFCKHIEQYKIPFCLVVPPVLVVLAHHPVVNKYNLSSLKYVISGAAPLGADLVKQVIARMDSRNTLGSKLAICQGYGLTETSPTCHILRVEDTLRKIGSIGPLLPNLEARLVIGEDEHGVKDAAPGEQGELWVRGPTIMKGYLNRPDATAEVMSADGFFKTGDIAVVDNEGYFYIVDRLKELIKYKGFQVPPAELEGVLLGHPDIVDVAVIGVDSPAEATELPRAYVVPAKPDAVKTKEAQDAFAANVTKWIQSRVAKHKYLRGGVVIVAAIPKSPSGKILRRELRAQAQKEQKGRDAKL